MNDLLLFSPAETILTAATVVLFVVQLSYYLVTYARPLRRAKRQTAKPEGDKPAVSVIVYAKNESENLRAYLPAILNQKYPEYDVIVVNDGSTDESDEVLKAFENSYPQLYHTYIPEKIKYLSRKKLALTIGIKAAKHDILLFTEANCFPTSDGWISAMVEGYSTNVNIVLGFAAYGSYKGFFHKMVAYDNLITGLQYISSALAGSPYAGDGRNLSYRKDLFFSHKGYSKSLNLHAGDDDLFVNESATARNTRVVYSPESITEMARVDYFKMWKEMKVSRAATQRFYKGWDLAFFRMESISYFLFLTCVIACMAAGIMGSWIVCMLAGLLFIIRFSCKAVVLHKSAKMLRQQPLTKTLFLLEIIMPLFNLYVRIYRMFNGKNDYTFRLGGK